MTTDAHDRYRQLLHQEEDLLRELIQLSTVLANDYQRYADITAELLRLRQEEARLRLDRDGD